MRSEEEKFDKLFREKLEGLEVTPPAAIWNGIQKSLSNRKRVRVILFYRVASAAAVVLVVMVAYWLFTGSPVEQQVVEQRIANPEQIQPAGSQTKIVAPAVSTSEKTKLENSLAKTIAPLAKPEMIVGQESPPVRDNQQMGLLASLKSLITRNETSVKLGVSGVTRISVAELTESDRQLIAMNSVNSNNKKAAENSWQVGFRISPGYSSQKSSHSDSYRQSMTYSNTEGTPDISGGIAVNYRTGKRWKVESGVYYSKNGQSSGNSVKYSSYNLTDNATSAEYFNTPVTIKHGIINMNSTAGVINFAKIPANIELLASLDTRALSSNTLLTSVEFQQVFDFIEIPVYLRYNVIDRKIEVDVVGGVSTNILAGNNVYVESGGGRETVGKTTDVAELNYSGALGLGVRYDLGKNLSLSVEPRFNYYLNSLNKNEAVDYHPYRMGIFTGLNYQF